MKKYDLYLFDFDGTIVDSLKSLEEIFVRAFKSIGIEVKREDCLLYTRQPLEDTYMSVNAPLEKAPIFAEQITKLLEDHDIAKMTESYPETLPILQNMRGRGMQFGIVTSNSEGHVEEVLDYLGIPKEWFVIIVGHEQVPETKPNPKPVLYALEKLKWNKGKSRVAYVGDALNDMLCANAAGIDAILVDRLNEFVPSDKYVLIHDLTELLQG